MTTEREIQRMLTSVVACLGDPGWRRNEARIRHALMQAEEAVSRLAHAGTQVARCEPIPQRRLVTEYEEVQ